MSVIVATAYMEEAERFDFLIVMNEGKHPRHRRAARNHGAHGDGRASRTPSSPCCRRRRSGHKALEIPPRVNDGGDAGDISATA